MAIVYIGMGSNLNNPHQQMLIAKQSLQQLPNSQWLDDSGLFQSKAMTMPDDTESQPDYINAVAKLETQLSPHNLLNELQQIENNQGRVREKRWGSRTLDLDILLYDDLQINEQHLTIPHPGIAERDFVLYPLHNIDSRLEIPGQGSIEMLLTKVSKDNIKYVGAFE